MIAAQPPLPDRVSRAILPPDRPSGSLVMLVVHRVTGLSRKRVILIRVIDHPA